MRRVQDSIFLFYSNFIKLLNYFLIYSSTQLAHLLEFRDVMFSTFHLKILKHQFKVTLSSML